MSKFSKPKIEIKTVSWVNGNTPHLVQAQVTLVRPNGDEKILVGDPMSTKKGAYNSLVHEVMQRQEDILRIMDVINETPETAFDNQEEEA